MDFGNSGVNSLSYTGVRATTPPQMVVKKRAPLTTDFIGYVLGTQWLHYKPNDISNSTQYVLVSVAQNIATWIPLHGSGDRQTLPNHSVALGTGVPGLSSTSPIATLGAALVSNGVNADPSFGVVSVSGGGTGLNACTPYSVYCGGTTGEGPVQQVSGLGTAGQVLTSQGNGSLPQWSTAGAGGAGGPIATQVFTTGSGTVTFTAGMGSIVVEVIGGGAGGTTATGGLIAGNGGGGGGYSRKFYLAAAVGASQSYAVGAGGAADTVGGNTTFGSGGTLITGSGGAASGGVTAPGIGGAGSGGDLNVSGGSGGISIQTGALANGSFSGFGGSSIFGNGAPATGAASGVGNVGTVYGSGGSGGVDLTGAGSQAGGAGASGIVIVTEYGPYGILPPIAATTINTIVLDTPGAGTYTPSANMNQVVVECVGGGGAAYSAFSLNAWSGAGGGYCKKLYTSAEIGASKPYFVGAGGLHTLVPGGSAGSGQDTTFGTGITLITAGGGGGGVVSTTVAAGGVATGGNININGQAGKFGYNSGTYFVVPDGGNSVMGFGGVTAPSSGGVNNNGSNGQLYGGGGSSPSVGTSGAVIYPGGDGASGVIIITEYIS